MSKQKQQLACGINPALIQEFHDNLLSEDESRLLRGHLPHCVSCREFLEEEVELDRLFKGLETLPAPPGFADRSLLAMRASRKRPMAILGKALFSLSFAVAFTLLIAMLVFWILPGHYFSITSSGFGTANEWGSTFRNILLDPVWLAQFEQTLRVLIHGAALLLASLPLVAKAALIALSLTPFLSLMAFSAQGKSKGVFLHVSS
ncbi:MAG: hypothetical protein QGG33_03370 [Candidatus Krumholzibacteria bacterium]|jgi:hypothetical protein|nr:hypothetical protein [Candidatus Krumholzibacteria bacterium]MDP7021350.1 hypothetical protein [Candidatus Krumholzibacteria bacterium]